MTKSQRISIGDVGERIALARWGEQDSRKPPALLLHGTGFVAEVWDDVATMLAPDYTVYALDRRGHGDSHKPAANRYHFQDYAEDVCRVIEALDLSGIYGIGHSAGATDLLLAAKLAPERFARLFVMEPTVMDPRSFRADKAGLSDGATSAVHGVLRRQAQFDSAAAAFQRFRAAPAFASWSESSLWAYIHHGFALLGDGRVRLRCTPEVESAILLPIFRAMEQVYAGDERGNPFAWLSAIGCPVRVATAELSWPVYKEMASRAVALIPDVSQWAFDGVGHCVAQEAPERLLQALQRIRSPRRLTAHSRKRHRPLRAAKGSPGINPRLPRSSSRNPIKGSGRFVMSDHDHHDEGNGVSRRRVLECMTWAGTGVLWTIAGGVPRSMGLVGSALAAEPTGITFLQISDSHVGFDKPANPNANGTLEEAINRIKSMPVKPSFMLHTGDITHLSKASEFDDAERIISQAKLDVHYVPGEHDFIDEEVKLYKERYGKGTKGAGWYSFDASGVHFIGLVNVVDLKGGGLGNLGNEQLAWLEADLKGRSTSQPIVVFAHIPLWTVYPQWGWGTEDGGRALDYLKGFGSVTVLNGHIHQVMQKVEGNVTFHTARSTAFPQPAPGSAPSPGPMKVEDSKLRTLLGVASINYKRGDQRLAIIDTPLQG